jgi:hypothetical protein
MADDPDDTKWHLDKKVPIALIVTIVLQTGVFIWWAARIDFRTQSLESFHTTDSLRIDALERERVPNGEFRAETKAKLDGINEKVTEIKNLLRMPQDQRR